MGVANTQRKERQASKCNVQTPIEIAHSGSLLLLDRHHILEVLPDCTAWACDAMRCHRYTNPSTLTQGTIVPFEV